MTPADPDSPTEFNPEDHVDAEDQPLSTPSSTWSGESEVAEKLQTRQEHLASIAAG
jgi:hypothetical protein